MSKHDLVLTSEGAPCAVVGKDRYPMVFTIASMKAWAERKGWTFEQVMAGGWKIADQGEDDLRFLLRETLEGGQHRSVVCEGGVARDITDELVDKIMSLCHPAELIVVLTTLWNEPPTREPDPQTPEPS